jgi:hypothetical protein
MISELITFTVSKQNDIIPYVFDGSISMKELCALISKFDPFNGSSLLPLNLLLAQESL